VRCWSCLSCDREIRWHYYFRRSVGHLFAVLHVFDVHSGKDADRPCRRTYFTSRARMCLVAQKPSPAVRRAEGSCRLTRVFGIYEPRSHRNRVCRVRDDLDKVVGGARSWSYRTPGLRRADHMGPKITGPGSSDVGAPLVRHACGRLLSYPSKLVCGE